MRHKLDRLSFVAGMLVVAVVFAAFGAAANQSGQQGRYDCAAVLGGMGLQIVDRKTNTMYFYRRDKDKSGDAVTYDLFESVDLAHAGQRKIQAQLISEQSP